MGHICSRVLGSHVKQQENRSAEIVSRVVNCASSALEVCDVILTLPLEPADPSPVRLMAEMLKLNGDNPVPLQGK